MKKNVKQIKKLQARQVTICRISDQYTPDCLLELEEPIFAWLEANISGPFVAELGSKRGTTMLILKVWHRFEADKPAILDKFDLLAPPRRNSKGGVVHQRKKRDYGPRGSYKPRQPADAA